MIQCEWQNLLIAKFKLNSIINAIYLNKFKIISWNLIRLFFPPLTGSPIKSQRCSDCGGGKQGGKCSLSGHQ